jgi:hypothetical protein
MTTTVEAKRKVERTEVQEELRGLLAAALLAVKDRDKKALMKYLGLAMTRVEDL